MIPNNEDFILDNYNKYSILTNNQMKTNAILSTLILLAVLLAACAPAVPGEPSGAGGSQPLPATAPAAAATEIPTQPEEQPQALATSRGDALVATDPTTVNLKSGTPTLLEFFRFT